MTPRDFAVSVQYGAGWHHFKAYFDTYPEAFNAGQALINEELHRYQFRKKRGAKPKVYIWNMRAALSEFSSSHSSPGVQVLDTDQPPQTGPSLTFVSGS